MKYYFNDSTPAYATSRLSYVYHIIVITMITQGYQSNIAKNNNLRITVYYTLQQKKQHRINCLYCNIVTLLIQKHDFIKYLVVFAFLYQEFIPNIKITINAKTVKYLKQQKIKKYSVHVKRFCQYFPSLTYFVHTCLSAINFLKLR